MVPISLWSVDCNSIQLRNPKPQLLRQHMPMNTFSSLADLIARFTELGATRIFFKLLSENDNSKQQIYLGGSFEVLSFFPHGEVTAYPEFKDPNFKADLPLVWVGPEAVERAPHAQLILYPKYPEIRLSGFLRGCRTAPNESLRPIPREERKGTDGRVLFFGITEDRRTLVHLATAGSELAAEAARTGPPDESGLFVDVPVRNRTRNENRALLLKTLGGICARGFVDSVKLDRDGNAVPYRARNGGGYTLEALLGVRPNGDAAPDFLGWEVKAISSNRITLMTPEPNGGFYGLNGAEAFVRKYGRHVAGKDQMYFTGTYRYQTPEKGLTMELKGFDAARGRITDVGGVIQLTDLTGQNCASWAFSHLLTHWNRKHASAVYVKYAAERADPPRYHYLGPVALGEHTDFTKYLTALANGKVIFDPGTKVDDVSTDRSRVKARSQFRMNYCDLPDLYDEFEILEL